MLDPRRFLAGALALSAAIAAAQEAPVLSRPEGGTVTWRDWLDQRGRSAVVLWASWTPGADAAVAELEALEQACRETGVALVVVAVQEPIGDSRAVLAPKAVTWLHDRHGAILKHYRLIRIPTLVVVGADGALERELPVSAAQLRRVPAP